MRRHAEHGADGDDAGAADAVDDRRPAACSSGNWRGAGTPSSGSGRRPRLRPCDLGAMHGDEGRAKAVDAGEILVAARLVDPALAAELGFERLDRDAVRLHAAIAAALADQFVDDDPPVGVRKGAALAPPALFGSAGLVVEQDRYALDIAQLPLHEVEIVAMMERRAGGKLRSVAVFVRLVGDDGDALDAFRPHLPGDHVDGEIALQRLAAGHRHGVVVEDLVGDVGIARNREANAPAPPNARRCRRRDSGRCGRACENGAWPIHCAPSPPICGEADGRAVHPQRHEVAADAGAGERAFGHLGRGIVRAARAEIGRARGNVARFGKHRLKLAQPADAGGDLLGRADDLQHPLAERDGDVVGVERSLGRKQPVAALVPLADDRPAGLPCRRGFP